MKSRTTLLCILLVGLESGRSFSQDTASQKHGQDSQKSEEETESSGFEFVEQKILPHTPVKNQAETNTCWCFATNSFLESEILRASGREVDLSEMFVVRHTYPPKAEKYIRRHGKAQFAGGGLTNNVLTVLREHGAVPESAYPGKVNGRPHDHSELDRVLQAMLDAALEGKTINPAWREAVEGTLDAYLGEVPHSFEYDQQQFTPQEFASSLGISADDYVQLTSYTHHPFYREVPLEIPDNWAEDRYWNVPLDELIATMANSIQQGFTFAWDGDTSENTWNRAKGLALLPAKPWYEKTKDEKKETFKSPQPELQITQDTRQEQFDNFETTDDHLMHAVGVARDQMGTRYFIVKDSHGTLDKTHQGLIYMSEPYVRSKTMAILVHRSVLSPGVAAKLSLP